MLHAAAGTLAAIALAAMAVPAFADDKIATDKGDLVIHPFHHASMMLTWNGVHILVDPAPPVGGAEAGRHRGRICRCRNAGPDPRHP